MLGAMIGDIIGSVYEWNNVKSEDFALFPFSQDLSEGGRI